MLPSAARKGVARLQQRIPHHHSSHSQQQQHHHHHQQQPANNTSAIMNNISSTSSHAPQHMATIVESSSVDMTAAAATTTTPATAQATAAPSASAVHLPAAVASAMATAAMDASSSAPPESLLREWTAGSPPPAATVTAAHDTHDDGAPSPPVAPAIFISPDSALSPTLTRASRNYGYPVATFVSNFVRTTVDHIADHIENLQNEQQDFTLSQHLQQAAANAEEPPQTSPLLANNTTWSVRSEDDIRPPLMGSASEPLGNNCQQQQQHPLDSIRSCPPAPNTRSRTVNAEELMDQDAAEFVLVDGDLIALPPAPPPNEQEREGLEEALRDRDADMRLQQRSCQPTPVRRGVRGFRKWFRKKTKLHRHGKHNNNEDYASATTTGGFAAGFPSDANMSMAESSVAALSQETPAFEEPQQPPSKKSPRNKSPLRWTGKKKKDKPSKKDKKQRGRSWRRQQDTMAMMGLGRSSREDELDVEDMQDGEEQGEEHRLEEYYEEQYLQRRLQQQQEAQFREPQHVPPVAAAAAASLSPASATIQPPHAPLMQQPHGLQPWQQQQQAPGRAGYTYDALQAHTPPPPSVPPMSQPLQSDSNGSSAGHSVHASFVGNADQLLEAGVLPAACAEAYIEHLDYGDDKKDEGLIASVLPPDADYKVDKADAPDVEYMLRRAAQESAIDVLEASYVDYDNHHAAYPPRAAAAARHYDGEYDDGSGENVFDPLAVPSTAAPAYRKSEQDICPLSESTAHDTKVHNDILKLVMVGAPNVDKTSLARAIRQSQKRPKRRSTLGVDVHQWTPEGPPGSFPLKFSIWDVQGASREDGSANFGANAGIQSLFFSANALYLLVWDLAASNPKTYGKDLLLHQLGREEEEDVDSDEEDEEGENEFLFEEAKRQADMALQADIEKRVLSWVDCIARRGPGSSILPVAVIPEDMSSDEARRRCHMMQDLLERHIRKFQGDPFAPKLLIGLDGIMCVSLATNMIGIHELQDTILAIARDDSVFEHVGKPVTQTAVQIMDTVRRLKAEHKMIRIDHLLSALHVHRSHVSYEEVMDALHFLSSIGEVMYFGGTPSAGPDNNDLFGDDGQDDILSQYIILSRKWFVSALSCILRNDLKRELSETRRFMNMQCIYSNHQFPENPVIKSLASGPASSCPLLSSTDTNMLWQSMSFMREAADRSSELSETSTTTATMFEFLERLMVQSGVFLPLHVSATDTVHNEIYFVPSLMATSSDQDVWTFKTSESWMTCLCHSWLFRDGAPSDLMEHITVALVRDVYEFSRKFPDVDKKPPHRSQTFPLVRSSEDEFIEAHDAECIGRIKIHQIMCWQSSFLVKIGSVFVDSESGELKESFVEVFATLVDQTSNHCVASDAMRATMQRLVVSGKGQAGSHGSKLWKGGYGVVLDSIKTSLADFSNVDRQVVCPECLAHSQPRTASTWSWDSVRAAAESGSSVVRCIRGHRADSSLICGCGKRQEPAAVPPPPHVVKAVPEMLGSVVLIGLWDSDRKEIRNVGSGFIVDKRLGLIVTAAHVLFNMEDGSNFGTPYFSLPNAKVAIGVIPSGGHDAVWRYWGKVVAEDVYSVDACVVRVVSKFAKDIDGDLTQEATKIQMDEAPLDLEAIHYEKLCGLKLTTRFELEESVRILGFNQGGEGLLEQGKHVTRSADFSKGYVVRKFRAPVISDDSSHSSDTSSKSSKSMFTPREEIVVICPTISGHSGGPCVNNDGKVIGILSRADPGERQRCYLVPSGEIKDLVKKAKKEFTRPMLL